MITAFSTIGNSSSLPICYDVDLDHTIAYAFERSLHSGVLFIQALRYDHLRFKIGSGGVLGKELYFGQPPLHHLVLAGGALLRKAE